MTWLIFVVMATADPFAIKTLKFDNRNECVDYVNEPSNASTLAIEVIAIAGFNDELLSVQCLPESEIKERVNEEESA